MSDDEEDEALMRRVNSEIDETIIYTGDAVAEMVERLLREGVSPLMITSRMLYEGVVKLLWLMDAEKRQSVRGLMTTIANGIEDVDRGTEN